MTRRLFFKVAALLGLAVAAPRALAAHQYKVGDIVPPAETEWRSLPSGTLLVNDGPRRDSARWILVHRVHPKQIGTHRLPWGGVMSAALPWRPIERAHGERWRVVAFGVADDDEAVRDAAERDWTDDEREWSESVWSRKYEPCRPPLTEEERRSAMEHVRAWLRGREW